MLCFPFPTCKCSDEDPIIWPELWKVSFISGAMSTV